MNWPPKCLEHHQKWQSLISKEKKIMMKEIEDVVKKWVWTHFCSEVVLLKVTQIWHSKEVYNVVYLRLKETLKNLGWIWGSNSSDNEEYHLLGCDSMLSIRISLTFWRNMVPPSEDQGISQQADCSACCLLLFYSLPMKEAVFCCKTLVNFYHTTWYHIPEGNILQPQLG
jgi:hypothetical protein